MIRMPPYLDNCTSVFQRTTRCDGMTLRDYFAGMAMQSYLLDKDRDSFTFEQWAQASYEMADAMLKARGDTK